MLDRLFTSYGFAWGVRIAGFVCLASCAAACALVSRRQTACAPDGRWFDVGHLREPTFVLVIVGSMFVSLGKPAPPLDFLHLTRGSEGLFVPNFYLVSYATAHGVPAPASVYVLAVLNAGSTLGRVAPACLSDALGRFNILAPAALLAGLATLVGWPVARGVGAVMAYAAVYGFLGGAFNALIVPCIVQVSEIGQVGARVGLVYSLLAFPYVPFFFPSFLLSFC